SRCSSSERDYEPAPSWIALLTCRSVAAGLIGAIAAKPADDPPKKTTAELLVGTWRMEREGDTKYAQNGPHPIMEFTKDGKFITHVANSRRPRKPREGKYKLEGGNLHLAMPAAPDTEAREWKIGVDLITCSVETS
ncbi:MAG: hypothetical protein K2X82_18410, partial [Gemmataceae bacterium]|nr:hypothetical protein [Gemmataceae bacterium]